MAATLSLLPSSDYHHHFFSQFKPFFTPKFQPLSLSLSKINQSYFTPFSTSDQSSSSRSISPETQQIPLKSGRFLTNDELRKLEFLQNYTYSCTLTSGYLFIRVMNDFELDMIVELLAESFAESMVLPDMYLKLLGFLVKQYLVERRGLMPHAVTLIAYLRSHEEDGVGEESEEEVLVGTVEMSFDKRGANASPPTPSPPKNCPYICNMSVKKQFRRRGIGWHLLKASEELISNMSSSRDVYLHCRLIDTAPFSMYKKAGYEVFKTDSLFILLTLQRRKHLMCKELPDLSKPLETVIIDDKEQVPSEINGESVSEPLLFDEVAQNTPDMDK